MRIRCGLLAAAFAIAWLAGPAAAQPSRQAAMSYPVDGFLVEYALDHPAHPRLEELESLELELRVAHGGLLPPHPTTENVRFPLGRVPAGSRFYSDGLQHVGRELLAVFTRRGIDGVLVTFPDIEEGSGRDLRAQGVHTLRVRIWTGRVERVATVADGERFGDAGIELRTNHPLHAFIREGSPVQPGGPQGLLRVREIEDYAFQLSRHPGRRVDALLSPGALPGTTRIDYHVAEDKPWMVYGQLSNTGTEGTTDWRQRFGFSTNQLTRNDDLLRLDYVTGGFDEVQGVWGMYEAPVWRVPGLRLAAAGSWSEYDASEVGLAQVDAQGEQWQAGGRLIQQVFQRRELFVDLIAGASWRNVSVDETISVGGLVDRDGDDEDFFLPEAGLRLRRHTDISSGALDVWVDHNLASVAGTSRSTLVSLGAVDPDKNFTRVHWEGAASIYLEPALRWRRFVDPSSPASATLAHELLLITQGQITPDRLAPQFQQIAGGLYTVRGYEQALVAGDTVAIGSAEYRVHLPRLLYPDANAPNVPVLGKVKIRPEHVYGRPDWDFMLKLFVDAARVILEEPDDRRIEESNETLIGIGVGAELQLLRYVSVRVDVGWAQRSPDDEDVDKPEIHTALTLRY